MSLTADQQRTVVIGSLGLLCSLALWWVAAATVLAGHQIPTPPDVLDVFRERGFDYYQRIFSITLAESVRGYVVGVAVALVLAMLVLLVPRLEPVIMQFAVVTYCLPIVVLAPILIIVHDLPEPGGHSPTTVVKNTEMAARSTAVRECPPGSGRSWTMIRIGARTTMGRQ